MHKSFLLREFILRRAGAAAEIGRPAQGIAFGTARGRAIDAAGIRNIYSFINRMTVPCRRPSALAGWPACRNPAGIG